MSDLPLDYDEAEYLGDSPGLRRVFDNVQAIVPGVMLPVVKMATWNAIEDFYQRSTWRRELLNWCMPPNVICVDFNPFDGDWLVCWVLDVYGLGNYMVKPLAQIYDVQQLPVHNSTRQGAALVALKPVSLDIDFPPDLFMNWFDTITDGALYRLYMQPAKPYSSPQLATVHARQFRVGCQRARAIAQKQYTNGPGRWSYPYFADGKRKS